MHGMASLTAVVRTERVVLHERTLMAKLPRVRKDLRTDIDSPRLQLWTDQAPRSRDRPSNDPISGDNITNEAIDERIENQAVSRLFICCRVPHAAIYVIFGKSDLFT